MSLHVIETGEVVEEMTRVEAERITSRIADKLDSIADNLEQVLPLIGEALTRKAWDALDYASPTEYVSARFAGALTRLPVEVRRPVVAELSAAGMSTRAIAPIVGASKDTVHRDIVAGVSNETPEIDPSQSEPPAPLTDEPGQVTKLTGSNSVVNPGQELPRSENIIGKDGKEYKRPEPKSDNKPRPESITSQFTGAITELNKILDKFYRISENKNFDRNKEQVATLHGSDLNRAISELQNLADALN